MIFKQRHIAAKAKKYLIDVRLQAICLSLILSSWTIFTNDTINLDGILYLQTADRIQNGDWIGAYQLYSWFFYSGLIASLSSLLGIGLEASAYALNSLFSALLVFGFITLIRELGGDHQTMLIAAFVILFQPELHEFRSEIIRDHGYWAFSLLSSLFFLRYYIKPRWIYAIAWSITMVTAALFRIEAIAFLVLLPLVIVFRKGWSFSKKMRSLLEVQSVNLIIFFVLLSFLEMEIITVKQTGRLLEPLQLIDSLWNELTLGIFQKAEVLESSILNEYTDEFALIITISIPFIIFISKFIKALTPICILFLFWKPFRKRFDWSKEGTQVYSWLALISLIVIFSILFTKDLLQQRFLMFLVIILLIPITFNLSLFFKKYKFNISLQLKKRLLPNIILIFIAAYAIEGFSYPGGDKLYLKNAGKWLKLNTPPRSLIYTNNNKILFYSGRYRDKISTMPVRDPFSKEIFEKLDLDKYNYLAIWTSHKKPIKDETLYGMIGVHPVKIFNNRKNDKVMIFSLQR